MIVDVHAEVNRPMPLGWQLCFQHVTYRSAAGEQWGNYRFIWRKPNGELDKKPEQARLPDAATILSLLSEAMKDGWLVAIAPLFTSAETFSGKPSAPLQSAGDP